IPRDGGASHWPRLRPACRPPVGPVVRRKDVVRTPALLHSSEKPTQTSDDPVDCLVDAALTVHAELFRDSPRGPALLETQLHDLPGPWPKRGDGSLHVLGGTLRFSFDQRVLRVLRARRLPILDADMIQVFEQTPRRSAHGLRVQIVSEALEPAVAQRSLDPME